MPSATNYTFSHKEVLELLIKEAGIHSGEWMLQATFGFVAGNFGTDDENLSPGAMVVIQNLAINKATKDSPRALVADAAVVNPASST